MAQRVFNLIGVGLLAAAFLVAATRILLRAKAEADPRQVTIRFCHWQLESGLREAFDEIARQYMERHPHVRIEQIAVPGRIYRTWIQTRYVGNTLPDLVQHSGDNDEVLTRYYQPLTQYVDQPNPYNQGTELEGVPWRQTFLDGMAGSSGLGSLQEYYSITPGVQTTRMYCNLDLYRRIMGHERLPTTYAELLEVCRATQAYAQAQGQSLLPLAGSQFTANILMQELFRSQTQKLVLKLDRRRVLAPVQPPAAMFLDPQLTLDDPAIRSGYELMHDIGRFMQRGFLLSDRDEAIFNFSQGRALLLPTGSWDYGSIAAQTSFRIAIFRLPLPTRDDPRYGPFVLGPAAEGAGSRGGFHLSARSAHPEVAVDFLRFLTSQRGNQTFARISKWLPAIVGVAPAPESQPFMPVVEGYTPGFTLAPLMWGSTEMYRVQLKHLHKLVEAEGSVETFLTAMRPEMLRAIAVDNAKQLRSMRDGFLRQDIALAAHRMLAARGDAAAQRKITGFWQTQNSQEIFYYWMQWRQAAGAAPAPAPPKAESKP